MIWPVPNSYSRHVPRLGEPGGFWEDRNDRFHCGVDIYAPVGSDVLAIEDGQVVAIEPFTSPELVDYWNTTYYVFIKDSSGFTTRYAEFGGVRVKEQDEILAGQIIGTVGQVLNFDRIEYDAPDYIQQLKLSNNSSMLHLEMYSIYPAIILKYLGGNTFQDCKPSFLINPRDYLLST